VAVLDAARERDAEIQVHVPVDEKPEIPLRGLLEIRGSLFAPQPAQDVLGQELEIEVDAAVDIAPHGDRVVARLDVRHVDFGAGCIDEGLQEGGETRVGFEDPAELQAEGAQGVGVFGRASHLARGLLGGGLLLDLAAEAAPDLLHFVRDRAAGPLAHLPHGAARHLVPGPEERRESLRQERDKRLGENLGIGHGWMQG